MGITVGFIALFVTIVIPGLLFQRYYYYGEFSKQFTTKNPVIRSLVYAIIPGLIIQISCLFLYVLFFSDKFELSKLLIVHQDLLNSSKELTTVTKDFLDKEIKLFVFYSLSVYLMSIILGYLFSRLVVRLFKLDRSTKIFRYRNQWFYIFSGEVLNFQKFKSAAQVLNKPDTNRNNIDMVFADVLTKSANGETNLYTGFLADYDLDSSDISKLDKIYLLDASRYKRVELKNSDSIELKPTRIEKKPIPGSVFILPVNEMANINLLYVTSEKEKAARNKRSLMKKLMWLILGLILILSIVSMSHIFLFKVSWIKLDWYSKYFDSTNLFDKIIAFLLYLQVLSIFFPQKEKESEKFKFFINLKLQLYALLILTGIFVVFNFKWLCFYFSHNFQ